MRIVNRIIKPKKISIISMAIIFILGSCSYAQADSFTIDSDTTNDGTLYSEDANYYDALNGSHITMDLMPLILAGQHDTVQLGITTYYIYRGYLSFNTSIIPNNHAIVSANISVFFLTNTYLAYYELEAYNIEYENLDINDWNSTENFEGIMFNKTTEGFAQLHTMNVTISNINKTGFTQYRFRVSLEGSVPKGSGVPSSENSSAVVILAEFPKPSLQILTSEIPTPEIVEIEGTRYEGNITLDGSESYDGDGTIENYTWEITYSGGSATLYGETPTYYFREGEYEITLTVLDDAGVESSVTTSVTVYTPTGLLTVTMVGILFLLIVMIMMDKIRQAIIQNIR